jgi:hypothetical protein
MAPDSGPPGDPIALSSHEPQAAPVGPVSAGKPEIRLHLLRAHPGRVLRHSSSATGSGVWLCTVTTPVARHARYLTPPERARGSLDWDATYVVAACLAGAAR